MEENSTESISRGWKVCLEGRESIDATAIDPPTHFYYEPARQCYCYDYCPSKLSFTSVYLTEKAAQALYAYLSPVIFVVGVLGNLLILAMFLSKELKGMPSKSIFQALAITDTIALVSGFLLAFLWEGYDVYVRNSVTSCKINQFMTKVSTCASAWLVAALTVDRFISVNWPMKAHLIRYKHRVISLIITFICISLFYSHSLIYYTYDDIRECHPELSNPTYRHFYFTYLPWLDLALRFMVPFCIIVLCNIGMVYSMRKMEGEDITSTASDTQASKRLTRLFIVISTSFIITVLPTNIFFARLYYYFSTASFVSPTYRQAALERLIFTICKHSSYVNNAMNFFIYCIMGSKFRAALASILGLQKKK